MYYVPYSVLTYIMPMRSPCLYFPMLFQFYSTTATGLQRMWPLLGSIQRRRVHNLRHHSVRTMCVDGTSVARPDWRNV